MEKKLSLTDLKVCSFVADIEQTRKEKLQGGGGVETHYPTGLGGVDYCPQDMPTVGAFCEPLV